MFLPIDKVHLRNFLSFGPKTEPLELRPLNILIGPNGSGKSNLIEAIGLLNAATEDIGEYLRRGGGISEWFWKGEKERSRLSIEVEGRCPPRRAFKHGFGITPVGQSYEIIDERVFFSGANGKYPEHPTYGIERGSPIVRHLRRATTIDRRLIDFTQSIVSDAQEIDFVADRALRPLIRLYRSFQIYRARELNQIQAARRPQPADMPGRILRYDAANLAAVLTRLRADIDARRRFDSAMSAFYADYKDIDVVTVGGSSQVVLLENSLRSSVPATRLSDGTIRWLGLLAILLDPEPSPLICIEEPETGLHPDVLLELARIFREVSERTQLIVTTHSDTLIDSFTDDPESVIVCEKTDGATKLQRLNEKRLRAWIKRYKSLGMLWRRGELGGNRY
jgi:predicted ATPase